MNSFVCVEMEGKWIFWRGQGGVAKCAFWAERGPFIGKMCIFERNVDFPSGCYMCIGSIGWASMEKSFYSNGLKWGGWIITISLSKFCSVFRLIHLFNLFLLLTHVFIGVLLLFFIVSLYFMWNFGVYLVLPLDFFVVSRV